MISDPPAGFWRRFFAKPMDLIGFFGLMFFVAAVLFAFMKLHIVLLVLFLLGGVYYQGRLRSKKRATFGKRLLGVYVVRASDGGVITKQQAYARYLIVWLPCMILLLANAPILDLGSEKERNGLTEQQKQAAIEAYDAEMKTPISLPVAILQDAILAYYFVMALMVIFTKEKKGFHDLLCKTRVLRGTPPALAS